MPVPILMILGAIVVGYGLAQLVNTYLGWQEQQQQTGQPPSPQEVSNWGFWIIIAIVAILAIMGFGAIFMKGLRKREEEEEE